MRVLHVSSPSGWRGGEQQVAYLAQALHSMGVEQVILCPEGAVLAEKMMAIGLQVATFDHSKFRKIKLVQKIRSLCMEHDFSVIHTHDSHAHTAVVLAEKFYTHIPPAVVSRRVDFPVSRHVFSKWKYNHPIIKRIICVSEAIRQITAPAIQDTSKLVVVHSGIDLSRYSMTPDRQHLRSELNLPPDTILVGNLSALADHKDYPTFLRTAATIVRSRPDVHFIIAGEGPEEKIIRELITALQLHDHVHLLGFRNDVVQVMQSLDVFLITSVTEGLGTIVLEAFAAGVPVVATRAGGIPEMVIDNTTGLLAPIGDADALATSVLQVLTSTSLSHSLAEQARKLVEDFSFMNTGSETLAVYKAVIEKE